MTATILRLPYRAWTLRQIEIDRMCLAAVDEALNFPTDRELFEIEASDQIEAYTAPDEDCA